MTLIYILTASILLQVSAALLALRMIRITKQKPAWVLMAMAFSLMALRRCLSLYQLLFTDFTPQPLDQIYELVGLATSALMLGGIAWIAPLFFSIKSSEEALSAEVERMHQFESKLIQTSNDGIIANDRAGNILIFNEGAERILGYRKEEVMGKMTVDRIYPPGLAREIKKKIYSPQYGPPGQLVLYETVALSKPGEPIPVEVSASMIFEDGQEVGVVGFFRDLRERQELREKLVQSERLAVLGQMAAHISHEIKNPLMLIGGFARQILKESSGDPPRNQEKLQIIIEEVKRLEDFLIEVGSYAKLSEPDKGLGDLNLLVQETCHRLEPLLQESGIKLALDLDPGLPQVKFDPAHIRQVILNIAKNGIEAMPHGGTLTITSGQQLYRVFVQIADTGEGIPPENFSKVFQPFFSTKPKGSGLGLAISQKIMEAHHGEIVVESEPHQGTQVTFFLGSEF